MTQQYAPINVILADDHDIYRDGFRVMLNKIKEINLVGEAGNGEELIQLSISLSPDVIITDIKMPLMNGIEATKNINQRIARHRCNCIVDV